METCGSLVINGMDDLIDRVLVASRARVKDVNLERGKGHMGNPGLEKMICGWIEGVPR